MKKITINSICAALVCFFLSSFSAYNNNLPENGNAPLQDTTAPKKSTTRTISKKKIRVEENSNKETGETPTMKFKKKPS